MFEADKYRKGASGIGFEVIEDGLEKWVGVANIQVE
jgi:hypothetical protein